MPFFTHLVQTYLIVSMMQTPMCKVIRDCALYGPGPFYYTCRKLCYWPASSWSNSTFDRTRHAHVATILLGVQNFLRGVFRDAVYSKDIWHGDAIYPRIFYGGGGGAKNGGCRISYDTGTVGKYVSVLELVYRLRKFRYHYCKVDRSCLYQWLFGIIFSWNLHNVCSKLFDSRMLTTIKVLITAPMKQLRRIMYDEKVNLYVLLWRKVPSGA